MIYALAFAAVVAWIVVDTYSLFVVIDKDLAAAKFLGTEGFKCFGAFYLLFIICRIIQRSVLIYCAAAERKSVDKT